MSHEPHAIRGQKRSNGARNGIKFPKREVFCQNAKCLGRTRSNLTEREVFGQNAKYCARTRSVWTKREGVCENAKCVGSKDRIEPGRPASRADTDHKTPPSPKNPCHRSAALSGSVRMRQCLCLPRQAPHAHEQQRQQATDRPTPGWAAALRRHPIPLGAAGEISHDLWCNAARRCWRGETGVKLLAA